MKDYYVSILVHFNTKKGSRSVLQKNCKGTIKRGLHKIWLVAHSGHKSRRLRMVTQPTQELMMVSLLNP